MSELRANTISDAAGTGPVTLTKQVAAKVWNRVNYSGGTPVIAESFNVSSVSDISVGIVNNSFTSAMASANFSPSITGYAGARVGAVSNVNVPTTSTCETNVSLSNTAAEVDVGRSLTVNGDLA